MPDSRPVLKKGLSQESFRQFYYLKEELVAFCREEGLSISGGKPELTERIAYYLETGEKLPNSVKKRAKPPTELTLNTPIEENITCSEKHRVFFKKVIGDDFKFNVRFLKWLRENPGKTYADAIEEYHRIQDERKKGIKTDIGRQFEYNTYIRDFFADNKGHSLNDAIICWNHRKRLPGNNSYERSDLSVLEDKNDHDT
jgi:SAP domain.